jgi:PUA domain protein
VKRTQLKSKEVNRLLEKFNVNLSKKNQIVLIEEKNIKLILVDKTPSFFYYKDRICPTLKYLQDNLILKKITVDMGAIKFVINGADIMRPGIVNIEDGIEKNDLIIVIDEKNGKPLSVGITLLNSEEMNKTTSGKVIKNIHFVGDHIWKYS